jgi:L-fuculose-phosphate aldolase
MKAPSQRTPAMTEQERALRQAVIDKCLWMNTSGLNQGTSGNISVRHGEQMLITPSATAYEAMIPEMIATMPIVDARHPDYGRWEGPLKPSTEWRFHLDILNARPDAGAIVHAHPIYCTTLAIARRPIPAVHYMIAAFGGADIRCADYAMFGTEALSRMALKALEGRAACLLANHGSIAVGPGLDKAMWLATELEALAHQYFNALQIGGGVVLSDAEIAEALGAFAGYGLQDTAPGAA